MLTGTEVLPIIAFPNLIAFLLFGIDKSLARNGARRISESTLFSAALVGGSLGAICGMYAFRHKTMKPAFRIGLPAILLAQTLLAAFLLHRAGLAFAG